MLTCVDVEIASTPSPFAIAKPYSMSASVVVRTFMLYTQQPELNAGIVELLRTGFHVSGDVDRRHVVASRPAGAPASASAWLDMSSASPRPICAMAVTMALASVIARKL